ncbi:pyridoxamine 5'-phosphate oxidase family protein (plasmid) [Phyllobacterium sp. A18/5-2]|uniref:pyridoxamine 5'-phosphate oxidase family protein n=1 Tax=Phyllobacterium sp. A18/5-2 TaxID=2978392 RepID=UPI0021C678F4|nr:pyridoxamine 5'-phosphate oxidase family protein [Phyllobacterium sp. A18/5-2]UXN66331.1 pyridoxamine 5'-phosphate oxidase family protein [Phyllobacterium sp. A18/5-2]
MPFSAGTSHDKSARNLGKIWELLKSGMTMMLRLVGVEESHTRPMTAQLDGQHGPIWFFTSTESSLVQNLGDGACAVATFASKGHDIKTRLQEERSGRALELIECYKYLAALPECWLRV